LAQNLQRLGFDIRDYDALVANLRRASILDDREIKEVLADIDADDAV
jgi:hypothetical protein